MIGLDLREHVAEPANLWIRHSFSRWPAIGDDALWSELATGGLRSSGSAAEADRGDVAELLRAVSDVVYVPPVPADHESFRSSIVGAATESGVPLLIQTAATIPLGESGSGGSASLNLGYLPPNAVVVLDLLDSLVRHAAALREDFRERRQPSLPFAPLPLQGASLVWPLVTGWTDQPAVLEPAMTRLTAAGARRVLPRGLDLNARDRRLLADRLQSSWPEAFDALFHAGGSPPDTRAFRCAAEAAGLEHRLPRPLPAPPLPARLRRARELAGHLIELGDTAVTGGDAYYRAARFFDRDEVDVEAADREGNLGVLPWLEDPVRRAVEQWLAERHGD